MKIKIPIKTKWFQNVCFVFCYMLVILCLLLKVDNYVSAQLEEQLNTSLEDLSQQNIALIQYKINSKFNLLNNISKQLGELENYDYSQSAENMRILSQLSGFREIGIALPDGTAYMSTDTIYDISERDYFIYSLKGENYVSEVLDDMRDQAKVNVFSVPIKNKSDKVVAVLFGIEKTDHFMQGLQIPIFKGKGYTYIFDENGDVLQDSFQGQDFEMTNVFENLSLNPKDNAETIQKLKDGIKNGKGGIITGNNYGYKYAVFAPLNLNDWWLMTVVPSSVLQGRIQPILNSLHILCVILFISAAAIMIYILQKRRKTEQYLSNLAYLDPLTQLYNKCYLQDHFTSLINEANGKQVALILYNIHKFKMINEVYGTIAGNELLKQIGQILKASKQSNLEIAAHGYADEFAVLYFYHTREELEERIQKVLTDSHVILYSKNQILTNMSVGIYEIHDFSYPFEQIYNYANIAKNENKKNILDCFTYYSDELGDKEIHQKCLDDNIREGIKNKEFKAWFQPKFDCHTQTIVGCEALARWYRADGSILTPYHFVEISEKMGLIREIDELIFEDVCIKLRDWKAQGISCVPISVNLSRAYLNSLNCIDHLKKILDRYEIPSHYIQFEITETCIVDSEQQLNEIINKMHALGFKVSLDDFGVGYSSLMSIHSLNFDTLKIDKSFVDAIGSENGNFIIEYTIGLGRKLGLEVIVEGVETKEQYEFLKKHNCDAIQGYYFSKPLPSEEFREILQEDAV